MSSSSWFGGGSKTERRQDVRRRLDRRVTVTLQNGTALQGHTSDISINGISVMLPSPMPINQQCTIRFEVYCKDQLVVVKGKGTVTNCSLSGMDGFRIGMQFTYSDELVMQQLAEHFML